jgi:hypothetical protein
VATRTVSGDPVKFRVLIPKKLNVSGMIAPIRDAAIQAALDMGKDLNATIKTWKGDKPVVMTEAKLVPGGTPPYPMFHTSFTSSAWMKEDGSMGIKKYKFLDDGTRVRYAHMSKGFVPKTRSGQLNSWVGKGKLLFINKKRPLPGIKARHFTVALRKKWERPTMFRSRMAAAVKKSAKASGHG